MALTVPEIKKLYEAGQIDAALKAIQEALGAEPPDEEKRQLYARRAWCHYRQKKYDEALEAISQAGDDTSALRCRAYIRAYSAAHRDDAELEEIVSQLGHDVDAANALTIRARDRDCGISHAYVWKIAEVFIENANAASHDVQVANLLHNVGRFFLDKARNRRDLKMAVGTFTAALAHYGEVSNWHHRAAACFWMSQALERLTARPEALRYATLSAQLWLNQLELDPKNPAFQEKATVAAAAVTDLLAKCREAVIK